MIIWASLLLIVSGIASFFLIKTSIERLDTSLVSYYPFDVYFPSSGKWSTLFFIILVALFMVIVFFFARLNLRLMPA